MDGLALDDLRYLHSTRAELLRRLGRVDEAREEYVRARGLTDDGPEQRLLERRLTELAAATDGVRSRCDARTTARSESAEIDGLAGEGQEPQPVGAGPHEDARGEHLVAPTGQCLGPVVVST
jgi:hypothetical protein